MVEKYPGKTDTKFHEKLHEKQHIVNVAAGREPADLVLKNAKYINVFSNDLLTGDIAIARGRIVGIGSYQGKREVDVTGKIICPGFIDGHIHLESSLVSPTEFVRAVLPHGTTTVIVDPHEIANVMGVEGIKYMLQATQGLPVDVHMMLPSCVPATPIDEAGAMLDYKEIDSFYTYPRVTGLAEMMNYVGTVAADSQVLQKIIRAQYYGKAVDGHAPGLNDKALNAYVAAGVYSDHECSTMEEALEKLERGQMIMIREGTAAHNLEALCPLLIPRYADRCMFCTDDKHPSDLLQKGHMDYIIKKAIRLGVDPIVAVKVATTNAAGHFRLQDKGAIAPGYVADLVVVDSLENFQIESVYKAGKCVYENGNLAFFSEPVIESYLKEAAAGTFHVKPLTAENFMVSRPRAVIGMVSDQLITTDEGYAKEIDVAEDILKIAVVERHQNTGHIGIGYIKGYGLQSGAVATSISHDSHNIIVVGTNEEDMVIAANHIVQTGGGITVFNDGKCIGDVPLTIAGLMSEKSLVEVNNRLQGAKEKPVKLGVKDGIDPFMTLSFMSLPVIPKLRLTTRGVFDVEEQVFV